MNTTIDVILSAYNNFRDMEIVFDGYLRQTDKDFSIIIADDGSEHNIHKMIKEYQQKGLNIRHFSQSDKGFRKAKILNKAISQASSEFIILSDSDCVPEKHFISDYKESVSKKIFLVGRRVNLHQSVSNMIRSGKKSLSTIEKPLWLIYQSIIKGLNRAEEGIRLPKLISNYWSKKTKGAIGANMCVPRQALLDINGFDRDYEGYGMCDTDLEWRLIKSGIGKRSILGRAVLFHLHHDERIQSDVATKMLFSKREKGVFYCKNGIVINP